MPKHLHFFSNLNSKWQVTRKVILLFCKALNYTLCCNETQHQILSSHWINPGYENQEKGSNHFELQVYKFLLLLSSLTESTRCKDTFSPCLYYRKILRKGF